ncbi:MAG: bifunctional phosphopantothenoylcysteine decarboxylase/phosphopantothenate--cysteine ligase CoaBC [Solirubrobacteraceae bacterium]
MARLLLGVSGGIAAYKALELARLATRAGHALRVIQTEASLRFVGAASFEGITGAPVLSDLWERDPARGAFPDQTAPDHDPISHLGVVADADVLLVAPASANTLAKLAHGLADDLLSTAALAARCPVAVAPAMNNHMLEHPATRANLALLRQRGVTVLEPAAGALASRGEWGAGRLPEPAELLAAVEALVAEGAPQSRTPLARLRVLVTAGGTREPIDSVRYVGNRSSGRMGWALADEAKRRGAAVTVVAANVTLARNPRVDVVEVETARQLEDACLAAFEECDVLLMAAAVADYRPAGGGAVVAKLKKHRAERLELALERTDDVLEALSARRRVGQTLVGFAAEHGEGAVARGRAKLEGKGLDLVVVNDIARADIGFDVADNEVTLVGREGERAIPLQTKGEVAVVILDEVERMRTQEEARA